MVILAFTKLNTTMLLKCCIIILILSFKIVFCAINMEVAKKYSVSNDTTPVNRLTRELINKTSLDSEINRLLTKKELSGHIGRFLEEYTILTEDKYILSIFRLAYENSRAPSKYPILLVHGMFQSSDRFLQQTENRSLAYKLQDFGYDVWLANTRGNKYSRRHALLEPEADRAKFFNYSYEEIGLYDIAAIVDFILDKTKSKKMHYIGYSLGGTNFLVLNSKEPKYNEKFELVYLLAPIGYQKFFPNSDLEVEAHRCDEIYEDLLKQGSVEIFPYELTNKNKLFRIGECLGHEAYENICSQLKIDEIMGIKTRGNQLNDTRGGSIKQLAHLAQNIRTKSFSQWDYGEKGNEERYGTKEAPKYNLGLITATTKIIYAPNDEFVSPKDIADMAEDMVHAVTKEVGRKDFKHQDFIIAPDVMDILYGDIIKELEENANNSVYITRRSDNSTTDSTNSSNANGESSDEKTTTTTEKDEDDPYQEENNQVDWVWTIGIAVVLFCSTLFLVVFIRTVDCEFFIAL